MIKVIKHLRTYHNQEAVSFHLECLLYRVPDTYFQGNPSSYIPHVLHITLRQSQQQTGTTLERLHLAVNGTFCETEWNWPSWKKFHSFIFKASKIARKAYETPNRAEAIEARQALFGSKYFPKKVSK